MGHGSPRRRALSLRRCAVVAAAATLLLAPVSAHGTDTPPADPPTTPSLSTWHENDFTTAAAELPGPLQRAIERDLGIAPAAYLARAEAAREASAVATQLEGVLSAWLAEDDALHVIVADDTARVTAEAAGAVVEAVGSDPLGDAAHAARAQQVVTAAYADRAAAEVTVLEARPFHGGPAISDRTETETGPVSHADTGDGPSDVLGGRAYAAGDDDTATRCATAFAGTDASGTPLVLTAGRCAVSGFDDGAEALPAFTALGASPAWTASVGEGQPLGNLVADSVHTGEVTAAAASSGSAPTPAPGPLPADGDDTALLAPDESWQPLPLVASWYTAEDADEVGADETSDDTLDGDDSTKPEEVETVEVHDAMAPLVGTPACTVGPSSGWSCAPLLATDAPVSVSDQPVTGFLFGACTLNGDSGAPILSGPYALGLVSGSTSPGECGDWATSTPGNPGDLTLGYALTGSDHSAEARYESGWDLAIAVGAPEIDQPSPNSATGPTPTFAGSAAAAPGAVVEISIDGQDPIRTELGEDRRFSVTLPRPLRPDSYGYRVTVEHTALGATGPTVSDPVGGRFTVLDEATAGLTVAEPRSDQTSADPRPTFSGTGEPGARVRLVIAGATAATGVIDDDGAWVLRPTEALPAGRYSAEVRQRTADEAGSRRVAIDNLGVIPAEPTVELPTRVEAAGAAVSVTGSGVGGAEISIDVGATVRTTTVSPDGHFSVDVPIPAAGEYQVHVRQSVDNLASAPVTAPLEVIDAVATDEIAEAGSNVTALLVIALVLALGGAAALLLRVRGRTRPRAAATPEGDGATDRGTDQPD